MTVYLGADHRGFALKEELVAHLKVKGYDVEDLGAHDLNPQDDYVDFAHAVAMRVSQKKENRGVVLCGSGVGVLVAANKTKNIRCGMGMTWEQVTSARADDDMNVLALASDYITKDDAFLMVETFLQTPFKGEERHRRRLAKIEEIENAHE